MTAATLVEWATANPTDLLIWTHGFGWALALRRGRIRAVLDRLTPGSSGKDGDEQAANESASGD